MATNNLPAPLPCCDAHGQMVLRPGRTPEQRWCGTWYDCPGAHDIRCGTSVLLPSPELLASLDEQRKRGSAPMQLAISAA